MGAKVDEVWQAGHFRWENDDGTTLDDSTFIVAEDTTTSYVTGTTGKIRLRHGFGETATGTKGNTFDPELQFKIGAGSWVTITGTSAVQFTTSAILTDADTSTTGARLTAPTGAGAFVSATFDEDNAVGTVALSNEYIEHVFQLQIDETQVTDLDSITFQIIDALAVETISGTDATPILTVSKATATETPQSIIATAIGTAALTRQVSYKRTIAASTTGTVVVDKQLSLSQAIAATAIGTVSLVKSISKTLTATAIGVAALSTALIGSFLAAWANQINRIIK